MNVIHRVLRLLGLVAVLCWCGAVQSQGLASSAALQSPLTFYPAMSARPSLGLSLGKDRWIGGFWGVELGYADAPRLFPGEPRAQGLNFSLVGKAPLSESIGIFGKVGTNYARTGTATLGAASALSAESGFGFTYGAGVSYSITPRLSATLEWDSNDLRFAGGTRDAVRSTSLGLRYRY